MWIYLDGRFVQKEEAKVSVFDHGLLYGDGVFEGIRAYDGKVFRLDAHLDRLYDSAKTIDLAPPFTKAKMKDLVLETLRKNKLRDGYIRPGHHPRRGGPRPRPPQVPEAHGLHHRRGMGRDVRGPLREGLKGGHRLGEEERRRGPPAQCKDPQLPEQHPREDGVLPQGRATRPSSSTRTATSPRGRGTTSSS